MLHALVLGLRWPGSFLLLLLHVTTPTICIQLPTMVVP